MARATVTAGLIIEIYYDPKTAFFDGAQTLYFKKYEKLVEEIKIIASAVN